MKAFLILFLIMVLALAAFAFLQTLSHVASQPRQTKKKEDEPPQRPLTEAEREVFRQANAAFDWKTCQAVHDRAYTGQLPELDAAGYWTNLYPNIYHTKIAGINFCRGIKDLAGMYVDCRIEAEPKNKYDPNAIKILHKDGRKLGYIPADETDAVRAFLNGDLSTSTCRAHVDEGEEDYETDSGTWRTRTYLIGEINITRPTPQK